MYYYYQLGFASGGDKVKLIKIRFFFKSKWIQTSTENINLKIK
jgi:hypothetical protein